MDSTTSSTPPPTADAKAFKSFASLSLLCLATLMATRNPWWLPAGLLCGYGFAWVGHFVFEKNKPASFKRPLYSFMGDWVMYKDIWSGKVKI